MPRPDVSWFPVRHLKSAAEIGHPTLESWFARAYEMGLTHVELALCQLPSTVPEMVRAVRRRLKRHGLSVSAVSCHPDFTHPDSDEREVQYRRVATSIEVARALGAPLVNLSVGPDREEIPDEDELAWSTEILTRLATLAQRGGVTLCLENRYRDPGTVAEALTATSEQFLELLRRLKTGDIGVTFNTGDPLATAANPSELLGAVMDRVKYVHVSDRFPGQHSQTVVGQGDVDFDAIFARLSAAGYEGLICIEDSNPEGDRGAARSLEFVRRSILRWWR